MRPNYSTADIVDIVLPDIVDDVVPDPEWIQIGSGAQRSLVLSRLGDWRRDH